MRVLIGGSSGLIGTALLAHLQSEGHHVTRLVRSPPRSGEDARFWNPDAGVLDSSTFEGIDAVVHLGGASIASLWTRRRKAVIRNSRARSTRLLAERMAEVTRPPSAFVHASAVGYYGSRGDEMLTESSPPGTGFSADLCRDWEAASMPAQDAGVRVVRIRNGLVLSRDGGVLKVMLPAFRLGIGGPLGNGRQWMPWIAIEDVVRVYAKALAEDSLRGSVNGVAPDLVTNAEFTRTLGRALGRPTFLPVPAFALRLLPGRMADEALLASERVVPEALVRVGYQFRQEQLRSALASLLGSKR